MIKRILKAVLYQVGILKKPNEVEAGGKERLDLEYKSGRWDYLSDLEELSRFSVIAGYCHYLKERPKILEIGCGAGTLASRLCTSKLDTYTGVDISEEAIKKAQKLNNQQSEFIISDAMKYEPDEKFDIIIFNECLIYFEHPDQLLKRYESYLNSEGIYMVSVFEETYRTKSIWDKISIDRPVLAKTKVQNGQGLIWDIKVFAV